MIGIMREITTKMDIKLIIKIRGIPTSSSLRQLWRVFALLQQNQNHCALLSLLRENKSINYGKKLELLANRSSILPSRSATLIIQLSSQNSSKKMSFFSSCRQTTNRMNTQSSSITLSQLVHCLLILRISINLYIFLSSCHLSIIFARNQRKTKMQIQTKKLFKSSLSQSRLSSF